MEATRSPCWPSLLDGAIALARATGRPTTFVMPNTFAPFTRARVADGVPACHAVSPDCDTATTRVDGVMMGLR